MTRFGILAFSLLTVWAIPVFGQPNPTSEEVGDAKASLESPPEALPIPSSNGSGRVLGKVGSWLGSGEFIRSHWVRMTADQQLLGRVRAYDANTGRASSAQFLDVEVFQDGVRQGFSTTDSSGAFAISGLKPGVYSFVARGNNGFLAFALHLLPSLEEAKLDDVRLVQAPVAKAALEINSAVVPPTFNQLRNILRENYSRMKSYYVPEEAYQAAIRKAVEAKRPGWDTEQGPEEYRGTKQLNEKLTDPRNTANATTIQMRPVYLDEDNILEGRLCGIESSTGRPRLIDKTTVYIIRNDRLVTSTNVDEQGFFRVKLRRPAVYSIVAAGEDGFGALSFRAVRRPPGQDARNDTKSDAIRFASRQVADPGRAWSGLVVGMAEPVPIDFGSDAAFAGAGGSGAGSGTGGPADGPQDNLLSPDSPSDSTIVMGSAPEQFSRGFPAGSNASSGSGRGFGSTGGGVGRPGLAWLGVGGLAAGITALAVSDDDVVSPFLPPP